MNLPEIGSRFAHAVPLVTSRHGRSAVVLTGVVCAILLIDRGWSQVRPPLMRASSLDGLTVTVDSHEPMLSRVEALKPALVTVRPLSASLSNDTGRSIMALALRWTWTAPDGKVHRHEYRTDSYFLNSRPVLRPGEHAIVYPGLLLAEPRGAGLGGVGYSPQAMLREYAGVSSVTLVVDALLLDDGTLSGGDEGRLVAYLNAWSHNWEGGQTCAWAAGVIPKPPDLAVVRAGVVWNEPLRSMGASVAPGAFFGPPLFPAVDVFCGVLLERRHGGTEVPALVRDLRQCDQGVVPDISIRGV